MIVGISFLFFALMIGLRPLYFPDTVAYIDIYNGLSLNERYEFSLFRAYYHNGIEYGYVFLCLLFKFLGFSARGFFVAYSLITTLIAHQGVKLICKEYIKPDFGGAFNSPLFLAIYASYFGFYYQTIAIRSGIAIVLGVLALGLVMNKKYLLSGLSIFVAFTFHRMSILLLFVLLAYVFLPVFKVKKKYLYLWVILLLIYRSPIYDSLTYCSEWLIRWLLLRLNLMSAYAQYLELGFYGGISKKAMFYLIIGLLPLIDKKIKEDGFQWKILNIYYIGLIIIPLTAAVPLANRIFDYIMALSMIFVYLFASADRYRSLVRFWISIGISACYFWLVWSIV